MRRLAITSLMLLVCASGYAAAESVTLQINLEGVVSRLNDGRAILKNEESWILEFPKRWNGATEVNLKTAGVPTVKEPEDPLKKWGPEWRFHVRGEIEVNIVGNVIRIVERKVQVDKLRPMLPGVRISGTMPGSPAAGRLSKGDVIREIDRMQVKSWDHLVGVLRNKRNKEVTMVIERDSKPKVVKVALQKEGPPLGIEGDTIWTRDAGVYTSVDDDMP